jgi:hypothetical protein
MNQVSSPHKGSKPEAMNAKGKRGIRTTLYESINKALKLNWDVKND